MLTKNDIKWEKTVCNFCHARETKTYLKNVRYFENDISFTIVKCRNCGLVYVNPRPVKKDIGKFYKSESYWGDDITKKKTSRKNLGEERIALYGPIYKLLENKTKSKILDIGAGTGLFLSKLKEEGWKTFGIEYSIDAVSYANKKYKLKIQTGDFLDRRYSEKFDVITMTNVLEHLHKPYETLVKANKSLTSDGIIILTVPNINSLGFKIFGREWYPLQPPIHLYQFSPKVLSNMLENAGFNKIQIIYPNWEHNYFSLFESFRSLFTKRNCIVKNEENNVENVKPMEEKPGFVKRFGILFGKVFSRVFSILGVLLKRGESMIIYAEKN